MVFLKLELSFIYLYLHNYPNGGTECLYQYVYIGI